MRARLCIKFLYISIITYIVVMPQVMVWAQTTTRASSAPSALPDRVTRSIDSLHLRCLGVTATIDSNVPNSTNASTRRSSDAITLRSVHPGLSTKLRTAVEGSIDRLVRPQERSAYQACLNNPTRREASANRYSDIQRYVDVLQALQRTENSPERQGYIDACRREMRRLREEAPAVAPAIGRGVHLTVVPDAYATQAGFAAPAARGRAIARILPSCSVAERNQFYVQILESGLTPEVLGRIFQELNRYRSGRGVGNLFGVFVGAERPSTIGRHSSTTTEEDLPTHEEFANYCRIGNGQVIVVDGEPHCRTYALQTAEGEPLCESAAEGYAAVNGVGAAVPADVSTDSNRYLTVFFSTRDDIQFYRFACGPNDEPPVIPDELPESARFEPAESAASEDVQSPGGSASAPEFRSIIVWANSTSAAPINASQLQFVRHRALWRGARGLQSAIDQAVYPVTPTAYLPASCLAQLNAVAPARPAAPPEPTRLVDAELGLAVRTEAPGWQPSNAENDSRWTSIRYIPPSDSGRWDMVSRRLRQGRALREARRNSRRSIDELCRDPQYQDSFQCFFDRRERARHSSADLRSFCSDPNNRELAGGICDLGLMARYHQGVMGAIDANPSPDSLYAYLASQRATYESNNDVLGLISRTMACMRPSAYCATFPPDSSAFDAEDCRAAAVAASRPGGVSIDSRLSGLRGQFCASFAFRAQSLFEENMMTAHVNRVLALVGIRVEFSTTGGLAMYDAETGEPLDTGPISWSGAPGSDATSSGTSPGSTSGSGASGTTGGGSSSSRPPRPSTPTPAPTPPATGGRPAGRVTPVGPGHWVRPLEEIIFVPRVTPTP